MTVVPLDYMAQLEAHMAAAEKAGGEEVVKGAPFFGVSLARESIRMEMLNRARSHGFNATFYCFGRQWCLRLAKRKDGRGQ